MAIPDKTFNIYYIGGYYFVDSSKEAMRSARSVSFSTSEAIFVPGMYTMYI